ncbi:transcriptional regulator PpsR [Limibaculum sp. FT325]|uniref:transcriptional regulator PpsR n=1 Tax=Thermohalobaculum sediminis TaxID=2939436 RepID=UPI0020C072B5|nr:transcriptional regulator PpsR [Limibaculum sediminis]MCL5778614.1 transcriptional regulator PpsR [Limibaculum sediminis]
MKNFAAPKESLGGLGAVSAARLIATAADIALVVDAEGVIQDLALDRREMGLADAEGWIGRLWIDTVTTESRPKIEALIRDAMAGEEPRWRQVNHSGQTGIDIPVLYSAVKVDETRMLVVFGRDLRTVSSLQQRLIEAQQALEKDYARLRHLETRYRLLFQLSSEPVLVVDGASEKVLEANPAALAVLDRGGRGGLMGRRLADCFEGPASDTVESLLTTVRATGRADEAELPGPGGETRFRASVSLLRQETAWVFLVRLALPEGGAHPALADGGPDLSRLVSALPDAFVVTAPDGTIQSCNGAFLDMVQIATEEQARGESLERWLGRPGVDLSVMLANLHERGALRLFSTVLRGDYGTETDVEISASIAARGGVTAYCFVIRDVSRRISAAPRSGHELPQSVDQLTELVGRVSLKDVVRQTTDMIEKLYIEAALEMTGDNRASAAEMLGLSRQSLYVKLRRFGIRDYADGE